MSDTPVSFPAAENPIGDVCIPGCVLHPENWSIPEDGVPPSSWKLRPEAADRFCKYLQSIDEKLKNGQGSLRKLPTSPGSGVDEVPVSSILRRDPAPFSTGFTPQQRRLFVAGEEH
jgi:hypothetical protein